MAEETDHYRSLGVTPKATAREIRTAYRTLVQTAHPDKGGDPEKFARVQGAYDILGDEEQRRRYDSARSQRPVSDSRMAAAIAVDDYIRRALEC